jgi:entericidin B
MIRNLILAFGIAAMALSVSACNTVRGAGDDLKSAANSVDRAL